MTQENKTDLQKWQSVDFPSACRFVYDEATGSFEYLSEDSIDGIICFVCSSDSSDDHEPSFRRVHFSQENICSEEEDGDDDETLSSISVSKSEFEYEETEEEEIVCKNRENSVNLNNNSCCCIIV